ncbi:MAG: Sec-independent protein translocase protein TatB [Pseudomonadota bacterium]
MFEVGFWEIALIAVVALLVVGPERLPALARTAGYWVGKLRRMVAQVKEDVEREIRADELRQALEEKKDEFSDITDAWDDAKDGIADSTRAFRDELDADVADSAEDTKSKPEPSTTESTPASREAESSDTPAAASASESPRG